MFTSLAQENIVMQYDKKNDLRYAKRVRSFRHSL